MQIILITYKEYNNIFIIINMTVVNFKLAFSIITYIVILIT